MVEITLEGLMVAFGWIFSVCLAVFVAKRMPGWAKEKWAEGAENPKDPVRVAFGKMFDADILPKVEAAITKAIAGNLADLEKIRAGFNDFVSKFNAFTGDFQGLVLGVLVSEEGQKALASMMRASRKGDGGGRPPNDLEDALAAGQIVSQDPELAQIVADLHTGIDTIGPLMNWDPAKRKAYHKQLGEMYASGQGEQIRKWAERLGVMPGGGGTPSVALARKGGKGGPI